MNFYQKCIVFFITHKYILWILISQQILYTSSVTSNRKQIQFIRYNIITHFVGLGSLNVIIKAAYNQNKLY